MKTFARLRRWVLCLHQLLTGRQVLARLEDLNRTQWLGRNSLLALQREKLQRVIEYAYQHVLYYRETFDRVGFHPDDLRTDINQLSRLPILTKEIIRERFDDLVTTEPRQRRKLTQVTTSGSSGAPLLFLQDNAFRDAATADIQRHLGWAGWRMGELHAYIWGASFEVGTQEKLRTQLLDWTWNRFLTNAFLLTEESLTAFTAQVRRRRPKLLFGYASSLHRFAQFVRQRGYDDITLDGVFSSAEMLFPAMRELIEETFHCRVFNRYGSKELGGIACECSAHTGLHVSIESNYVEILADGRPVQPGKVGDVIVTNLNNLGMPFIRYSIGDAAAWHVGEDCPCGRAAPMLETVQGRVVDVFKTRDGRMAWAGFAGAGYSVLSHPAIKQFQVIQKTLDLIVIRLVKTGDIPQTVLDELVHTIHTAFGENVQVRFEFPSEIPVLSSGKHRYAISELSEVV